MTEKHPICPINGSECYGNIQLGKMNASCIFKTQYGECLFHFSASLLMSINANLNALADKLTDKTLEERMKETYGPFKEP